MSVLYREGAISHKNKPPCLCAYYYLSTFLGLPTFNGYRVKRNTKKLLSDIII